MLSPLVKRLEHVGIVVTIKPDNCFEKLKSTDAEQQFEAWLLHMDEAIELFLAILPVDLRDQMDGSPKSLEKLELWLMTRYPSLDAARSEKEAPVIGGAIRFFGEVLRVVTSSRWAIELNDEKFAFRGLPVLRSGRLGPRGDCPQSMVTAALVRRNGQYLSSIVESFATPTGTN